MDFKSNGQRDSSAKHLPGNDKSILLPQPLKAAILIGLLAAIAMGLAGCSETRKDRAAEEGKALFELHCCGCHNGKASAAATAPPNLAGIFQRSQLPSGAPATGAAVRSAILQGRAGIMPSFEGTLSDEQIEAIIRYLRRAGPETPLCTAD